MATAALAACGSDSGSGFAPGSDPALRPVDQAAMQNTVETLAKDMLVPGAVVILRTPKGNFDFTYGVTSYRGTQPTRFDQHIRVGSNTKAWVATVILQQVQEARIALADPVSEYRPEVPDGDNITIEHRLNMRSGLFNYSETVAFNQTLDDEPQKAWTQEELLAIGFASKPYFAPGAGFHYSNTNYILLGLVAEQLDGGKPLEAILRDRLFGPLGLADTLLPPFTSNVIPTPYSRGYMYGDNVLTMGPLPPEMQVAARAGTLAPGDQADANPSWAWAAGSGISTANDLVAGVRGLVNGTLLNADLQARRRASVRPVAEPAGPTTAQYGWGIAKLGNLYGHTGELPGYNSFMAHDPVHDVTLVVWTDLGPAADDRAPATTIVKALIGEIYAEAD